MDASLEDLVRRALRKEAAAFTQLIGRHERMALSIAYSIVGDAERAGDIAQEAFVRAWRRLGDLKDPARFASWLGGIVRNLAIDVRRRRANEPVLGLEYAMECQSSWEGGPADAMVRREEFDALAEALGSLDELSRMAVVLRYYEGWSSKQIGELIGLAPTAVDMRLSRARRQLRQRLADGDLMIPEK